MNKPLLVVLLLLLLGLMSLGVYAYIQSQKCTPSQQFNYLKLKCQEVDCNNNGNIVGGKCVCNQGYAGTTCQFSRKNNCNNRGDPIVDSSGKFSSCKCDDGYSGVNCEQSSADCSGNGQMNVTTGVCNCNAGYFGNLCQYSRDTTCSGKGTPGNDGTCVCDDGFYSSNCGITQGGEVAFTVPSPGGLGDICAGDANTPIFFTGTVRSVDANGAVVDFDRVMTKGCVFTKGSAPTIPGWDAKYIGSSDTPGTYYPPGLIPNPIPFSSSLFSINSTDSDCNGQGLKLPAVQDGCICNLGYAGDTCQYSRSATCGGNGTPGNDGSCVCDSGYAGSACQYSRSNCNNRGTPGNDGSCVCDSNAWSRASNCGSCSNSKMSPACGCTGIWNEITQSCS